MDWNFWALIGITILALSWNFFTTIRLDPEKKQSSRFSIAQLLFFTLLAALAIKLAMDVIQATDLYMDRMSLEVNVNANEDRLEKDRQSLEPAVNAWERNKQLEAVVGKGMAQAKQTLRESFELFVQSIHADVSRDRKKIGLARIPVNAESTWRSFNVREFFIFAPEATQLRVEPHVVMRDGTPLTEEQLKNYSKRVFEFQWETDDGRSPTFPQGTSTIRLEIFRKPQLDSTQQVQFQLNGKTVGKVLYQLPRADGYLGFEKNERVGEVRLFDVQDKLPAIEIGFPLEKSTEMRLTTLRFQLMKVGDE